MKHHKILCGYADGEKLKQKVNDNAELGYVIDHVLQQSDNGTHICIIMAKEE